MPLSSQRLRGRALAKAAFSWSKPDFVSNLAGRMEVNHSVFLDGTVVRSKF